MKYALGVAALLFLAPAVSSAQQYGPDTCISGFVWREAYAGDHVCVDPAVRLQVSRDNQLAAGRRQSGGGPYGPDTCRKGFVWRQARPDDHVCVPPQSRDQAAADNGAAGTRVVRATPPSARGAASLAGAQLGRGRSPAEIRDVPLTVRPPVGQPAPERPASSSATTRGFDSNGNPYIEDPLPDGSRRREQSNGVTVIHPDGSSQFYPRMVVEENAQPPSPPELPEDPAKGWNWVNNHNAQLLLLITLLVHNDASELALFHQRENQTVGSDSFKQIRYRMDVLSVLARP